MYNLIFEGLYGFSSGELQVTGQGHIAGWTHSSQTRRVGWYGSSSGELQDSTGQGLTIRWTYSGQ